MDSEGRTPLHLAAKVDSIPTAEILIQRGAHVMAPDVSGKTPIDYAKSLQMISLLKSNSSALEGQNTGQMIPES
jgi:ankyrin repeat protein